MDTLFLPLLFLLIMLGVTLEIISLFRSTDKVEFGYFISSGATEPGKPIEIATTVTNKSILPISYLSIKETFPQAATFPSDFAHEIRFDGIHIKRVCRISSRSRKKMVLQTSINKRGVYIFRADSIEIGDFLGFKELNKTILTNKQIVIYPQRYEGPDLIDALSNFQGDIVARRYLIRDPILTASLREYTGREPMREIHWPKSARHGKLMVREFDYNRQLSVNVLLSIEGIGHEDEDRDDLDKCCSMARTICETLVAKNIPVTFFTNAHLVGKLGQDIWKCDVSTRNTQGVLEILGRVTNYDRSSLTQLLEFTHRASDPASVSILITAKNAKNIEGTIAVFTRTTGREVVLMKAGRFTSATEREAAEAQAAAGKAGEVGEVSAA